MTRPRAAAVIALVAVTLAGCTADAGGPSATSTSRTAAGSVPGSASAPDSAAVAPSTSRPSATDLARGSASGGDPVPVQAPAPSATDPGANLPLTWESQPLVRPGWTELPQQSGNLLLGYAAPDGSRASLRFVAVDSSGTVRWQADRPATCTGYAVSSTGGRPVAVLTDLRADGATMRTTASGYDLASGTRLWGPVAVPGSLQGPGLVFAAPAPASTMGAAGPRVALDPASGAVVVDEAAGAGNGPGTRIVGEYGGIVVTAEGSTLRAIDSGTRRQLWQADNPAGSEASAPAGVSAPDGAALIGAGPRSAATLVDLTTGATLATGVRAAAFEPLSRGYLALGDGGLTGIAADGRTWHQDVPAGSRISAAGSGLVYLVSGGVGRVFNALTGHAAGAYRPEITSRFAVPQRITTDGAAVFLINGEVLLAASAQG